MTSSSSSPDYLVLAIGGILLLGLLVFWGFSAVSMFRDWQRSRESGVSLTNAYIAPIDVMVSCFTIGIFLFFVAATWAMERFSEGDFDTALTEFTVQQFASNLVFYGFFLTIIFVAIISRNWRSPQFLAADDTRVSPQEMPGESLRHQPKELPDEEPSASLSEDLPVAPPGIRERISRFFGLQGQSVHVIVIKAIIYLAALFPLVMLAGIVSNLLHVHVFGIEEQELQDVVVIFTETDSWSSRLLIIFTAVVFAPLVEEIIFRGYVYRTGKRFGGAIASAVLISVIFAVVHDNTYAILPLFVLALGLTLAYELQRNLWVPIVMHAIFNGMTLVFLLVTLQFGDLDSLP